jgi:hypothetical protein
MVAWLGGLAVLALITVPAVLVGVGGQPSGGAKLASAPTPFEFPHLVLNLPDTELVDAYENLDEAGERVGTHTVYLQTWITSGGEAAGEVGRREILLRIQEAGAVFDEFDYYSALAVGTETLDVNGRSVTVHLVPDEAIEEGSYDLGILQWTEAPGYEVILIPWGLDKDAALSVMAGLTTISEREWEELRGPKDGPFVTTTMVESETITTGAVNAAAAIAEQLGASVITEDKLKLITGMEADMAYSGYLIDSTTTADGNYELGLIVYESELPAQGPITCFTSYAITQGVSVAGGTQCGSDAAGAERIASFDLSIGGSCGGVPKEEPVAEGVWTLLTLWGLPAAVDTVTVELSDRSTLDLAARNGVAHRLWESSVGINGLTFDGMSDEQRDLIASYLPAPGIDC